jgi:hypothetical protein
MDCVPRIAAGDCQARGRAGRDGAIGPDPSLLLRRLADVEDLSANRGQDLGVKAASSPLLEQHVRGDGRAVAWNLPLGRELPELAAKVAASPPSDEQVRNVEDGLYAARVQRLPHLALHRTHGSRGSLLARSHVGPLCIRSLLDSFSVVLRFPVLSPLVRVSHDGFPLSSSSLSARCLTTSVRTALTKSPSTLVVASSRLQPFA